MNTIEVKPLDVSKVEGEQKIALTLLEKAKGVCITTQGSYEEAGRWLQTIKGKIKDLDFLRKGITQPLDTAKKAVMDLFRPPQTDFKIAEGLIKKAMVIYSDDQERKVNEKAEKLRRQAVAEEARKKKELEKRAKKAEDNGNIEKAEELREKKEDVHIEAPVLAPTVDKLKGVHYIDKWTAEVFDFKILPDEYKVENIKMLTKIAQATKGEVPIPGVKFKKEKLVASGSI